MITSEVNSQGKRCMIRFEVETQGKSGCMIKSIHRQKVDA